MPDKPKLGSLKSYRGRLSLDWYGKEYSIAQGVESDNAPGMVPPPRLNWVNKEGALFYEIDESQGKGVRPVWVRRGDIRVHESRPLVHVKTYTAAQKKNEGTLGLDGDGTWAVEESAKAPDDPLSNNMLIKGDNLLALNTLKKLFENKPDSEKIKCIYIDPPYNTGSGFLHYSDNLEHSEWLTLIRDRLVHIRSLLSSDGSLWVSVDDDEMQYLKIILDDIFGRENFVACNVWQKRYSRENREAIGDVHEYILVYAIDAALFKNVRNKVPPTEKQLEVYKNPNNDPRGRWRPVPITAQAGHAVKSQFYRIVSPSGRVFTPPEGRCWGVSQVVFEELRAQNRIWFGNNGDSQPNLIRYLSEIEGFTPWTWWPSDEVGHTDEAKKEMFTLFGKENPFETPKPERLLKRIFEIASDENDLVADFFLGSGTSVAVATKLRRRWIGLEMGDQADQYVLTRMLKVTQGDDGLETTRTLNWSGGGSFSYYHLGESMLKVDEEGYVDLNWEAGREWLESAILSAYDYRAVEAEENRLGLQKLCVGRRAVKGGTEVAVVSLCTPSEVAKRQMMGRAEWEELYKAAKKLGNKVFLFTNRGLELAADSKPDDLIVIRVPDAICTTE